MKLDEIISFLGPDWQAVQNTMNSALVTDISLLSTVNQAILAHGGKMMRPALSLLTAQACGGVNEDSVVIAAASELLHNATLLHDDVADNSDERRGRPTLNNTLGSSAAVLVGDFWLARAMELILKCSCHDRVVPLFSKTLTDLAEGEMLQLQKAEKADTSEEDYFRIIFCKTASLFVASAVSGAISSGADKRLITAAQDYATASGIAFQIKDDILDYAGGAKLGKPLGLDLMEQKITLPLLCVIKHHPEVKLREMVRNIPDRKELSAEIRSFVIQNGGVEMASDVLDSYIAKAERALEAYKPSKAVECLREMVRFNSYREL